MKVPQHIEIRKEESAEQGYSSLLWWRRRGGGGRHAASERPGIAKSSLRRDTAQAMCVQLPLSSVWLRAGCAMLERCCCDWLVIEVRIAIPAASCAGGV